MPVGLANFCPCVHKAHAVVDQIVSILYSYPKQLQPSHRIAALPPTNAEAALSKRLLVATLQPPKLGL